jgi:hypothetical protein
MKMGRKMEMEIGRKMEMRRKMEMESGGDGNVDNADRIRCVFNSKFLFRGFFWGRGGVGLYCLFIQGLSMRH